MNDATKAATEAAMIKAIRKIIGKIKTEKIFDSNFVIKRFEQEYPDEFAAYNEKVRGKVGLIGKQISRQEDLVKQEGETGAFWSMNIKGKPEKCTGWRRK